MKLTAIIDRFEGNTAVLEIEDKMVNMERTRLPKEACEGDVLVIDGENITVDKEETKKRLSYAKKILNELLKKNESKG